MRGALLRYLVLGLALWGITRAGPESPPAPSSERSAAERPAFSAARLTAAEADFERRAQRPVDAQVRRALVRRQIEDELLLAEAERLGFHRSDPNVLRRRARNRAFLGGAEALATDGATESLWRSDPVVRRYLIQRLERLVRARARLSEPSDTELAALRDLDPARWQRPLRLDLEISGPGESPVERSLLGLAEIERRFGPALARAVGCLDPGEATETIVTRLGLRRARLLARQAQRPIPVAAIRNQLREVWFEAREVLEIAAMRAALQAQPPPEAPGSRMASGAAARPHASGLVSGCGATDRVGQAPGRVALDCR